MAFYAVILAGGFGEDVLSEIDARQLDDNPAPKVRDTMATLQRSIIQGSGPTQRVTRALAPLHQRKAIEYVLQALEAVPRLAPLQQSLRIVANDCDIPLLSSALGSVFSSLGLSSSNLVSNGVTHAAEYQGEVADLQHALKQIGPCKSVLVISSRLTLLPGFNMQRVLEHSLLRDRDTVAVSRLQPHEVQLMGPTGHCLVHTSGDGAVPLVTTVLPEAGYAGEGDLVAQPMMVLKPSALAHVGQGGARTLEQLAAQLAGQVQLHGISVGAGVVSLSTALSFDFANKYLHYYLGHTSPRRAALAAVERKLAATQAAGHGSPVSADAAKQQALDSVEASSVNQAYRPVLEDNEALQQTMSPFLAQYFTEFSGAGGPTMQQYRLPSTFYMSAYRRLAAAALR